MDTGFEFAPEEQVTDAIELIYENETDGILTSSIFGLYKALFFINFGCIKDTDSVILSGSNLEIAALLISYIHSPYKLVVNIITPGSGINSGNYETLNELLSDYRHAEIIFTNSDADLIKYEQCSFDVAIAGFADLVNTPSDISLKRFGLETGIEYEIFEKLLIRYGKLLSKDGRFVVLSKPGWILKAWNLIHDLGLQLEYDNYCLYTDFNRNPNSLIWLRFVKRVEEFHLEMHKKNMLSLMVDSGIDRLYAHRNNLRFPYAEMSYSNSEAYVKLEQNLEYMQYFFSLETTTKLAQLCEGYTACLVTPSIAQYAYKLNKNIVLFDRDNRFRENGGLKFIKYDLNMGLTKFLYNRYANKFDRVICDPPFDIKLDILANDIVQLLKKSEQSVVYVVYPCSRRISLINAMKAKGLSLNGENKKISIEYARPPKIVRVSGKDAIQLYKFTYSTDNILDKLY